MTDTEDTTADAGEGTTPAPRKKLTYQDVVEAVITRSDEDRAWTIEQNGLVQKQITAHTAMLADMFANQQKNQAEDRRHQQETIAELTALVRAVVGANPAPAAAQSTASPGESETIAAETSATTGTEKPAAGDHEGQATQPVTEDDTATQNHPDPDESGAAASDGAPTIADTEDGGGRDAEGAVENTDTRSDEEHRPAPAADDPEPTGADHDDTAGKPAAARDGNDPEPGAPDKTPAAAVEGESEEQTADHDEASAAAGEDSHTAEDDTDAEVVERDNGGEEAGPGPNQATKPATPEQNQETIVKPLRAIEQTLVALEKSLPDVEDITKENTGILDVLALIREATDKHTAWISSLVGRLPLPAPPAAPAPGGEITPTEHALLTVMGRLDEIVLILNGPQPAQDMASTEEPDGQPRQLDPDVKAFHAVAGDLSRQITTDRSNYSLLAWAGAGLATVAIPLALALGILVQQQFAPLAVPDPTLGWKDRVWASVGPTIAQCMSREDAGAGDCIVAITTPGE